MEVNKCVVIVIIAILCSFILGRCSKEPLVIEKKIEVIKEIEVEKERVEQKDKEINTKIIKADGTIIEQRIVDLGVISSKEHSKEKTVLKEVVKNDRSFKLGIIYTSAYSGGFNHDYRNLGGAALVSTGFSGINVGLFGTINKQFGVMVVK